jgi:hypothetical protein
MRSQTFQLETLVTEQALALVGALEQGTMSLTAAEETLFQLKIALFLQERGGSPTCQEILTWGMQLEDWQAHRPEKIKDAYAAIRRLANKVLVTQRESLPVAI